MDIGKKIDEEANGFISISLYKVHTNIFNDRSLQYSVFYIVQFHKV